MRSERVNHEGLGVAPDTFLRFFDILADAQPSQHLEVGETVEEQDPLGEPVRDLAIGVARRGDRLADRTHAALGRAGGEAPQPFGRHGGAADPDRRGEPPDT